MATFLRLIQRFVLDEEETFMDEPSLVCIEEEGVTRLTSVNESTKEGYIELRMLNGDIHIVKTTMLEFDKKLKSMGHIVL